MDSPLDLPPLDVPALLRAYGLRPKKGLGQNFLIDPTALKRVVAAAEIDPRDVVLEIGPGLGSLTRGLCRAAGRVVAVELDASLFPPLERVLATFDNVTLVQGDILKLDPAMLMGGDPYKVVANIPYYITSAVIRHLLEVKAGQGIASIPGNVVLAGSATLPSNDVLPGSISSRPERIVLTVQKEVAQRICALPGDMNLLALSVQVFGTPRLVASIPAGAFYPAPDVDSSVVRIDIAPNPLIAGDLLDRFFELARAGFGQKRKKLRNALSAGLKLSPEQVSTWLESAGIDPGRRAETLGLEEWQALVLKPV
jgi:16S rRNA (adenine1518-N6/adenine1519-N6)-dimethyltransferase